MQEYNDGRNESFCWGKCNYSKMIVLNNRGVKVCRITKNRIVRHSKQRPESCPLNDIENQLRSA